MISVQKILFTLFLGFSIAFLNVNYANAQRTSSFLEEINPAKNFSADGFLEELISGILPLSLTFGGFILVVMLVMGGYTMMTSVGDPQAQEGGKQKITWSIIGFLILFSAFWIWQLVNVIFGIDSATSSGGGGSSGVGGDPTSSDDGEICDTSICVYEDGSCACGDGSSSCSGAFGYCCNGSPSGSACP